MCARIGRYRFTGEGILSNVVVTTKDRQSYRWYGRTVPPSVLYDTGYGTAVVSTIPSTVQRCRPKKKLGMERYRRTISTPTYLETDGVSPKHIV